jgi:NADH-quinone oxidoreductase subunit F
MEKLSSIGKLEWLRNKILSRKKEGTIEVHVCMTGCRAYGAAAVLESLKEEVKSQKLSNPCHRLSRFLRQGAGDCH